MKNTLRLAVTISALAAAVASHAVALNLIGTQGSGVTAGPTTFTTNVVQAPGLNDNPFSLITSGVVTLTATGAGSTVVYSTATPGAGTFSLNFSGTYVTQPGLQSLNTTGTVSGATGIFSGFANASGTLLVTSNTNVTDGSNGFVVTGNLNPVPEPSAFAALGLGAAALLRRRRKA